MKPKSTKEKITEYWSERSKDYDLQPGHEIFSYREKRAWTSLLKKHLGDGEGKTALDIGCGTGVISHLLFEMDFNVTAIDCSEEILVVAKNKSIKRGIEIEFKQGDAENTEELSESYDVIVMRHVVWTLVDPSKAFSHWYDLLKPNGILLIIDGDFVHNTILKRIIKNLQSVLYKSKETTKRSVEQQEAHQQIMSEIYFNNGAHPNEITALLKDKGFEIRAVQTNLSEIHKAQFKHMRLLDYFARRIQNRYAICAIKPT